MPASVVGNGYLSAFARLIGLGTAEMDDYPLLDKAEVCTSDGYQLRTPESSRESDQ